MSVTVGVIGRWPSWDTRWCRACEAPMPVVIASCDTTGWPSEHCEACGRCMGCDEGTCQPPHGPGPGEDRS